MRISVSWQAKPFSTSGWQERKMLFFLLPCALIARFAQPLQSRIYLPYPRFWINGTPHACTRVLVCLPFGENNFSLRNSVGYTLYEGAHPAGGAILISWPSTPFGFVRRIHGSGFVASREYPVLILDVIDLRLGVSPEDSAYLGSS